MRNLIERTKVRFGNRPPALLSVVLTAVMLLGLLPPLTMPAYAAAGDTEADPLIVSTFADFKAAMENPAVSFVQLNSVTDTDIPAL
jgi:cytochrome c556